MLRTGPEHHTGFRKSVVTDGVRIEVVALHHTRNRMPKPSEMMRQMSRTGHADMVKETEHDWRVLAQGRHVCNLRQHDNGLFFSGQFSSRGHDIMQVAIAATRRFMPGIFPVPTAVTPEPQATPEEAPPSPGPGRP